MPRTRNEIVRHDSLESAKTANAAGNGKVFKVTVHDDSFHIVAPSLGSAQKAAAVLSPKVVIERVGRTKQKKAVYAQIEKMKPEEIAAVKALLAKLEGVNA